MSATVRPSHTRSEPPAAERPAVLGPARVSVQRTGGVVVLRPLGIFDRALSDRLRRTALDAGRPVIIDLDDSVLTDTAALEGLALDPKLSALPELCLVSRRPDSRQEVARAGISTRFALFKRVEDAQQARLFARHGYGRGWSA